MAERPFVYRFTRDLRLEDHAGLAAAASYGPVLPVLIIDEAVQKRLKGSSRRAAFFCSAVASLDAELRERGASLIVRWGSPARLLCAIARETMAAGAAWSASYDGDGIENDSRLQAQLEQASLVARVVHDAPAIEPEAAAAVRTGDALGYRAFAPYFEAWCSLPISSYEHPLLLRFAASELVSDPLPAPADFNSSDTVLAGSTSARRHFERFLRGEIGQYAQAATSPGDDRTSHLSADLSFGTISPRAVIRAVRLRLEDPFALSEERVSLRCFLRALAHRDFFLQLGWFHPRTQDTPLQEKMNGFAWAQTHASLGRWREGRTGFPLVDAGVRQLHATGWMHPHVRAVVASWLCFDLGVDWRVGRAEWERWLIEDDVALATGNWQWIAGVGADMAQYPRIYNPERQRRRYDPNGAYVRRWIPELAHVPFESWSRVQAGSAQLPLGLYADSAYPSPALDHGVAARAFLRRYREFAST